MTSKHKQDKPGDQPKPGESQHEQPQQENATPQPTRREPTPSEIEAAEARLREGEAKIKAIRAANRPVPQAMPTPKPDAEVLTGEERARRNEEAIRQLRKELGREPAEVSSVPVGTINEIRVGVDAAYAEKFRRLGITEDDLKAARAQSEKETFEARFAQSQIGRRT